MALYRAIDAPRRRGERRIAEFRPQPSQVLLNQPCLPVSSRGLWRSPPRATIGSVARFYTYAEVLTPDHIQWEVHARGLGCGHGPGLVLQEVLDRNGGRYETTMPMSDGIREQARICAQGPGDEEIARIASLSEVTISLEHLRGLDPGTRIVCGYGLCDFTDAERDRLPRSEGPVGPATIIEGPFDPANPMRILRTSAGG
jgi:hypothetical protein